MPGPAAKRDAEVRGKVAAQTPNLPVLGEDEEQRLRRGPTLTFEPFGDPDLDDRLTRDPEALGL
jgi:hypothetical protein